MPTHLVNKKGRKGGDRGKAKWPKKADAASGEGSDSSDDTADILVAEAASARVAGTLPAGNENWIIDSGASYNFTPYLSDFTGPLEKPLTDSVRVGDGTVLPIAGMGDVRVRSNDGQALTFTKVHYVPDMHSRLLSVPHLLKRSARVEFKDGTCRVFRGSRLMFKGDQSAEGGSGLFRVNLPVI